jgi:hypothetical protein
MEERSKFETLAEHAKDYAELRLELVKLEAAAKVSNVVSSVASAVVIGLLSLFTLLFLSVGVAWWIGQANNNPSMGFFIVGGFYAVLGVVAFVMRNSIKVPVLNNMLEALHYDYDQTR